MQAPNVRPLPIPMPRGVHSYSDVETGRRTFYAITSRGALLNDETRCALAEEWEAIVEREMWRDLNRQDPVTAPPRLSLYVAGALRP